MSNNLRLTARDIDIVRECYSRAVVSFSQLHKWHFKDKAIATVSNRLSQLTRAGIIRKTRVGLPLLLSKKSEVGVIFEATSKGQKLLQELLQSDSIRKEPQRINLYTLKHDLALNEALVALEGRYPGIKFMHGRLLSNEQLPNKKRLPDAVIVDHLEKPFIAIELELTAKSEKRYREIILQYRLNSQFQRVLYITAGKTISDKIKRHITNQKVIPGLLKPATGKFYFVSLSDILSDPFGAKISNDSSEPFLTNETGLLASKGVNV